MEWLPETFLAQTETAEENALSVQNTPVALSILIRTASEFGSVVMQILPWFGLLGDKTAHGKEERDQQRTFKCTSTEFKRCTHRNLLFDSRALHSFHPRTAGFRRRRTRNSRVARRRRAIDSKNTKRKETQGASSRRRDGEMLRLADNTKATEVTRACM